MIEIRSGLRWAFEQIMKSDRVAISYKHGSETHRMDAVYGKTYSSDSTSGRIVVGSMVDAFVIRGDAIDFTPRPGDRIACNGHEYIVADTSGSGCWRWTDPHKIARRITVTEALYGLPSG
jgi:hypothetical protein